MKKIALLTASASVIKIGGIARYAHEQFRNIPKYSKGRFEIHKIILGGYDSPCIADYRLKQFGIVHNMTEYALIPEKKCKAIRINTANEFQILLYPKLSSKPKTAQQKIEYPKRRRGLESILKADYIFANSLQTGVEAQILGFDPKRIFVINLGIDNRFVSREPKPRKERKKFLVGHIGAIRRRKNMEFSFETMSRLKKSIYDFNLYGRVFADFDKELRKSIAKSKGQSSYRGIAPEKRIVEIYDGFDAFMMPSWYEGFGLEIIEAQSRGIPVIICNDGKIPQETRRYCIEADDPQHAAQIIEDLRENGYDNKKKSAAMEYARGFTWHSTAKKTVQAYGSILDSL